MEYPALVYRCPGAHFGPDGTTYNALGVEDDAQLCVALENGWSKSLVEAVSAHLGESDDFVANSVPDVDAAEAKKINEVDESAPLTREELEEKASEIGIKFDGRTTDRKLLEKIEEALRGE
jgi:hypothetical protein